MDTEWIAIRGVAEVKIRVEEDGGIFITQEDGNGDDPRILIWPEHVDELMSSLESAKKESIRRQGEANE